MSKKTILVAATMLALLAGCNRAATNNSAAANKAAPTANTATPAPSATTPAPAPADGAAVDAAFLTANPWGMLDACASTTTFAADGTFTESDGSPGGQWTLEGSTLTTTKSGGSPESATVRREGRNFVLMIEGAGEATMTPCPAG